MNRQLFIEDVNRLHNYETMDLPYKIRLMEDLIKENPDITIGEYSQIVKEIESVEHKTEALYIQTRKGILEVFNQKAAS